MEVDQMIGLRGFRVALLLLLLRLLLDLGLLALVARLVRGVLRRARAPGVVDERRGHRLHGAVGDERIEDPREPASAQVVEAVEHDEERQLPP
jgi:hypothetical protein